MKVAGLTDLHHVSLLALNKFSSSLLSPGGEEMITRFIGDIAHTIFRRQRRAIADRLSSFLSHEVDSHDIKRLTREVFRRRVVNGEIFWLSKSSPAVLTGKTGFDRFRIEGLECLRQALSRGNGVILWESPRFGKPLLAKIALIRRGFKLSQVHALSHGGSSSWVGQRIIRRLYRKEETKLFQEIIDIQDDSLAYLRLLIDRLRRNRIICISGLGGKGHKFLSVEFLGIRQNFPTGAVNLARMTGASLIPIFCFSKDDETHRLVLEKPINLESNSNQEDVVVSSVTQYVRLLESYVRNHPDQWHRWHDVTPMNSGKLSL
jgi:KDO2-lipid IV(A) lauroyltransferase